MTGGLLNLVSEGNQNVFLTGNPSKTFFKAVYKKYTNFYCSNCLFLFLFGFRKNQKIYRKIPRKYKKWARSCGFARLLFIWRGGEQKILNAWNNYCDRSRSIFDSIICNESMKEEINIIEFPQKKSSEARYTHCWSCKKNINSFQFSICDGESN